MTLGVRSRLGHVIRWRLPRARLQGIFERLHAYALYGMNVGGATRPLSVSGEAHFLSGLASQLRSHHFVCVDVGANIGAYTELVLQHFESRSTVYAIEPGSTAFEHVAKRFAHDPRVHTLRYGLSDSNRPAELFLDARGTQFSSLVDGVTGDEAGPAATETVQLRTLDDLCQELKITHIDLLKVDVEGAELSVLKGAKQLLADRAVSRIQFEYGERNLAMRTYFHDMVETLGSDYVIHRMLRDGLRTLGTYRPVHEIPVSATNYVAVLRDRIPRTAPRPDSPTASRQNSLVD